MSQSPEAYERLILDAMRGDATLFTRNDEVEAQWRIIDPIVQAGRRPRARCRSTRPASQGPAEAERPAARRRRVAGDLMAIAERADSVWSEQRHDAGDDRGRRCASCSPSATRENARLRPRARAEPRRASSTASGAARSPTGSRGVGRYHAVAHDRLRRTSPAARRSTRRRTIADDRHAGAGRVRAAARDDRRRRRRGAPRAPRHDRRPARRHRPGDGALVAARPPRGRRRAALDRPGRAAGLRRRARRRAPRSSATASSRRGPTSSTSPGCARRRGASASRRRSTRRTCRAELGTISSVRSATTARARRSPALLLLGWLASRLGWRPGAMTSRQGTLRGARAGTARRGRDRAADHGADAGARPRRHRHQDGLGGRDLQLERGTGGPHAPSGPSATARSGRGRSSARRAARPGSWARASARRSLRDPTFSAALNAARELA